MGHRRGGKVAFDTIVCFGANGSEPHYSPGDVKLQAGDMILIDFGSELRGYCSDITRMFVFGRAAPNLRAMVDVVARAQAVGVQETRAGAAGRATTARRR